MKHYLIGYIASPLLILGCSQSLPTDKEISILETKKWEASRHVAIQPIIASAKGTIFEDAAMKSADSLRIANLVISNVQCQTGETAKTASCSYEVSKDILMRGLDGKETPPSTVRESRKDKKLTYAKSAWEFVESSNEIQKTPVTKAHEGKAEVENRPQQTPPPAEPAASHWHYSQDVDRMDGKISHFLNLSAVEKANGGAVLFLRCSPRSGYEVMVSTGKRIHLTSSNSVNTRVKFGDTNVATIWWTPSSDHEALFSQDALGITKRLASAAKFTIEIPRYSAAPDIFTFELTGNGETFSKVLEPCGKKLNFTTAKKQP